MNLTSLFNQSGALFNTSGPEWLPEHEGWILPRFPADLRKKLSPDDPLRYLGSTGAELRFICDAPEVTLTVSSPEENATLKLFKGDYAIKIGDREPSLHAVPKGKMTTIRLALPSGWNEVSPAVMQSGRFPSSLWRIQYNRGLIFLHELDTNGYPIRGPRQDELPPLRWLAYGSSITQSNFFGYPQHAARQLKVDVLNQGWGGACRIEAETVDFLATHGDWDFATAEMGINMRALFEPDEFEKRVYHLVATWTRRNPGKPLVLITIFPNRATYLMTPNDETRKEADFNTILRKVAADYTSHHVTLIEGSALLDTFEGLSQDLLHPTFYGHARMGDNLAKALLPLVESLRKSQATPGMAK